MRHHTVTAALAAPPDEVFAYLADIEKLPEWATEFARELRVVEGRHKVVNGPRRVLLRDPRRRRVGCDRHARRPQRRRPPLLPHPRRRHPGGRQRLHLHHVPGVRPAGTTIRRSARLTAARVRKPRAALRLHNLDVTPRHSWMTRAATRFATRWISKAAIASCPSAGRAVALAPTALLAHSPRSVMADAGGRGAACRVASTQNTHAERRPVAAESPSGCQVERTASLRRRAQAR
jgi:Polyketide cyclase / dehydrase and lipid transport